MTRINITGTISMPSGNRQINTVVVGSATPIGDVISLAISSGDNTVNLPVGLPTSGCLIVPVGIPMATVLTFRSVNGDTGVSLGVNDPSLFSFNQNALPASITVHSSASGGELEISFF